MTTMRITTTWLKKPFTWGFNFVTCHIAIRWSMQFLGDLQLAEWLLQVLPIHVVHVVDVWSFGLPELQMRCHLRAGHLRIRFEKKIEKKIMQVWRFENLRTAASGFWLSHRWCRSKSTASPGVNKFSHLNLSNQLWKHARCRFSQHPTTESDSCRIFRASNPMRNGTIEDFAVSKRNQTSKVSHTDNPRPKKLCLIYKSWQNPTLKFILGFLFCCHYERRRSPLWPHDLWASARPSGRSGAPWEEASGGWTTSCCRHLNWAQYQMKSQGGRHDVGETSVEGGKNKRERHNLSASQGGKTHNTSWWRRTSLFVSRRGWGGGRIVMKFVDYPNIFSNSKHQCPAPAREFGGPKRLGSMYHHGPQSSQSQGYSDPTPSYLVSKKNIYTRRRISRKQWRQFNKGNVWCECGYEQCKENFYTRHLFTPVLSTLFA